MLKRLQHKLFSLSLILILVVPIAGSINNFNNRGSINLEISNSIKTSGDISDIDLSIIPEINYTALNATWYEPKVEMLIVTPDIQSFVIAATPLMNWKNIKGIKTEIRNASGYSGTGADQVRNLIIDYYENENLKWVILAGDAQNGLIPIKSFSNPGSPDGNEPTDFYYADLNSDWSDITSVDWTAEVYVGRLPASTSTQLEDMVDKIIKYETEPYLGDWMNQMLLASGISNYPDPDNYDYDGEDEARLTQYLWQNFVQDEMNFTHMYRTTSYFNPIYTEGEMVLTSANFINEVNSNHSIVFFAGHGDSGVFADADIHDIYDYSDASNILNINKSFLIYSDACSTASYDINDNNIGEILIKKQDAGAIGYIGGLRDTFYLPEDLNFEKLNRGNAKHFFLEFFENNKYQQGRALYDSKESYVNSEYVQMVFSQPDQTTDEWPFAFAHRRNLLTYNLLGDPELDVYTDQPQIVSNPFPEEIYEGQLVSTQLVPFANVHLTTIDGMYHTAHADENGIVKFRLPRGAGITYNVTITGHNYLPTNFSFITLVDVDDPIPTMDCTPPVPTTLKNMIFNTIDNENKSGIESIYIFMSDNYFDDYITYHLTNEFLENISNLEITLNKLIPDIYYYSFYVVSRDYANNTNTLSHTFTITMPIPLSNYIFIVGLIVVIGVAGISVGVVYKGINRYSSYIKRIKD